MSNCSINESELRIPPNRYCRRLKKRINYYEMLMDVVIEVGTLQYLLGLQVIL